MFHVTDWLPTLLSAAGGDSAKLDMGKIDGVDQWGSLKDSSAGKRREMLYNINPLVCIHAEPRSAIR